MNTQRIHITGWLTLLAAATILHAQPARAPWPPPVEPREPAGRQQTAQQSKDDALPRLPAHFHMRVRGYEQAKELQQETGADIFLYISQADPSSARGLCTWWEDHGMKSGGVQRWLRNYIKVELPIPSDDETRAIADQFRLWNGPTVVVLHPNGTQNYIRVFEFPEGGGRPRLKTTEELINEIADSSSARYQDIRR